MNPPLIQAPITTTTSVFSDPQMQAQFQRQYMQQQRQRQQQLSTFNPNRISLLNSVVPRVQQQDQEHHEPQQQQQLQLLQLQQQQKQQFHEKPAVGPGRSGGPRLSLDTSDERLQNVKVINHNNKRYLKLFSPSLVESPVSYLDRRQLSEDRKLWENGPNEAFQKQLEMEKREAYRARSRQQLRGFFMGLWLGCLLGVLMLQQTSAKVNFWRVAIVRSGTRCTIAAVATCAAVLTCFATLIVNQSRYSAEFQLYKRVPPASTLQ
ncbi:hypothetical protein BGZ54_009560 [Gamsiella multidivaricata]|nr:hypothetical protein BGZ54_009560 [Gamsiella multidivaricata]